MLKQKFSCSQNLKKASTRSSITPRLKIFCFSPIADVRNGVEDEYRRLILPGTLPPERKIIFESSYYYPLNPDVVSDL